MALPEDIPIRDCFQSSYSRNVGEITHPPMTYMETRAPSLWARQAPTLFLYPRQGVSQAWAQKVLPDPRE